MTIVAAAPLAACAPASAAQQLRRDQRHVAREHDRDAVALDQRCRRGDGVGGAERPLLDGDLDCSSSTAGRGPVGADDTTIRLAPASRAAASGHASSGRPQRSWASFGVAERIRVPRPAARITTVGEGTPMSLTTLAAAPGGGSSNGKTSAFGAEYRGSNPCPPAARCLSAAAARSDPRLDSARRAARAPPSCRGRASPSARGSASRARRSSRRRGRTARARARGGSGSCGGG